MEAVAEKYGGDLVLETWQRVCVVAVGGTQSLQLELWDYKNRTVPLNNAGTEYGSVSLNIGATAYSLPQLLVANSYTGGATVNGVPYATTDGEVSAPAGGRFLNTGTQGIVVNLAGTSDGSAGAGNGIAGTAGRAPVTGGPLIVPPGSYILFGKYFQDPS